MKVTLNGSTIIISLTVLVALFLLLWRGCGGKDAAVAKANSKADSALSLMANVMAESDKLQDTLYALRRDSVQQRINTEALAEEANDALTARADAEDNTKKYQAKYEKARLLLDTMLAFASCDSLTLAITRERVKATAAQKACKAQVSDLGDVLVNRNKQIAVLNQQVAVLKQPTSIVTDALHAVKAATKEPWIKGYVGASVMGNQTSFGFGPDVSLLFRSGVIVRGGAVLMGSQVMGVVGVSKILSFNKQHD